MCQTTNYVLEFLRCATHFGGCVDLYIMCRTSAFGECATLRISSPQTQVVEGVYAIKVSMRCLEY